MLTRIVQLDVGWVAWLWSKDGLYAISLPRPSAETAIGDLGRPGLVSGGPPTDGVEQELMKALEAYYRGERVSFDFVPVNWEGQTPFTRLVLEAVRRIGYGRTMSYNEVAAAINHPRAARAVGGALSRNRTLLVVPCHRVLRSDGSIGGWSGAPDWKERLLRIEGITSV